jgi:hypothetical protein
VPLPMISRIEPIIASANVNPMPIPKPSTIEGSRGFLLAKASARANIMQFTTISGMKIPKL